MASAAVKLPPPPAEPADTSRALRLQGEAILRRFEQLVHEGLPPAPDGFFWQLLEAELSWLGLIDRTLPLLEDQSSGVATAWQARRAESAPVLAQVMAWRRDFYWSAPGQGQLVAQLARGGSPDDSADLAGYAASLSAEDLADFRLSLAAEQRRQEDFEASHPGEVYDPAALA